MKKVLFSLIIFLSSCYSFPEYVNMNAFVQTYECKPTENQLEVSAYLNAFHVDLPDNNIYVTRPVKTTVYLWVCKGGNTVWLPMNTLPETKKP